MNMNKIEFVDIVSKPVGITYSRIQTLGIYCWQYERTERRAAFFLPRLSFNSNKEYLENLYPGISKKDLQGKGIFTSIWKIAKFYNKVSILNPEEILYNDFATLSAFKCWVERDSDLKRKKEKGEELFLQIYVLENESRFAKFKYTEVQNSAATIYYDWSEIPEESEEIKSK
ncbi:hypothetical protein [uncultured Treponema sp.]|uniref:hypothetical protein n=1 Tax=uncultured Treponema sp. TaxID=162155 RepID=UPI0025F07969|nr:hypothetical protein [uncultured Treponema sp.]